MQIFCTAKSCLILHDFYQDFILLQVPEFKSFLYFEFLISFMLGKSFLVVEEILWQFAIFAQVSYALIHFPSDLGATVFIRI